MTELMEVLEVVTYLSFILLALFAVFELRIMARDRTTQLVLSMMEAMSSRETQEMIRKVEDSEFSDAEEAEEKCGRVALHAICGYHEGLGYIVRRKMIAREAIFETVGVLDTWEKVKPWALKESERERAPRLFEHFEYSAEIERTWEAKT